MTRSRRGGQPVGSIIKTKNNSVCFRRTGIFRTGPFAMIFPSQPYKSVPESNAFVYSIDGVVVFKQHMRPLTSVDIQGYLLA